MPVALEKEVVEVLEAALGLRGRSASFGRSTVLLGALPELDSMGVLNVITMLEERFGITIHDDAIDGAAFSTVGTLADWLAAQVDPTL
jgi:acyl carrier protein